MFCIHPRKTPNNILHTKASRGLFFFLRQRVDTHLADVSGVGPWSASKRSDWLKCVDD